MLRGSANTGFHSKMIDSTWFEAFRFFQLFLGQRTGFSSGLWVFISGYSKIFCCEDCVIEKWGNTVLGWEFV